MARYEDCEHSEVWLICPVCDYEEERARREAEELERRDERMSMFKIGEDDEAL